MERDGNDSKSKRLTQMIDTILFYLYQSIHYV
jgi:hypothetical protein